MNNVLALIHGGKSFIQQIQATCQELDLNLIIASSRIDNAEKEREIRALTPCVYVSKNHDLTSQEVIDYINDLEGSGVKTMAAISVWENYRPIMAEVNQAIGCTDLSTNAIAQVRDKHLMRHRLIENRLSQADSQPLTKELFEDIKHSNKQRFVKPKQGIASFGAFKLRSDIEWTDVEKLTQSIKEDPTFGSSFTDDIDLIVEDYIDGTEYCLEMIACDQRAYLVAIHEKIEIESIDRLTTLENVSATPPISLSREQISQLSDWVKEVFNLFNLDSGCFHVEAKLSSYGWEIIEINPRVGGAYINESVGHVTGYSLLNLWLRVLCEPFFTRQSTHALLEKLHNYKETKDKGAFFRVFYAEPGRIIRSAQFKNTLKPLQQKILMTPGTHIANADREQYIAQGLWPWSGDSRDKDNLLQYVFKSSSELEVVYE